MPLSDILPRDYPQTTKKLNWVSNSAMHKSYKIHQIHLLLSSVKKEKSLYLWVLNVPFIGLVSLGVTHVLWVWVLIYLNGWVITLGCLWVGDSTWAFSFTCWFLGPSVVPKENVTRVRLSIIISELSWSRNDMLLDREFTWENQRN